MPRIFITALIFGDTAQILRPTDITVTWTTFVLPTRHTLRQCLLLIITLGAATTGGHVSRAVAQETARSPSPAQTMKQTEPTSVPESVPTTRQFAVTFNPLNLLIGRYGFNFEYEPVPHHALIFTPHYDYLSGEVGTDGCSGTCSLRLNGVGVELGYRFYSGEHGFNGFFAGPSLIVSRHKLTYADSGSNPPFNSPATESSVFFTSIGGAFDVGWQWQGKHFIIGGSVGIQYTQIPEDVGWVGRGAGLLIDYNSGGGLLPRFGFNLGYAF